MQASMAARVTAASLGWLVVLHGVCLGAAACGDSSAPEVAASAAPAAAPTAAAPPRLQPPPRPRPIVLSGIGLAQPESVLHDAEADLYLVSNLAGKPLEKDGNGFISRIAPDGQVVELRFIEGGKRGAKLNAPKGMALVGDELYVADIDEVRVFDRATGASKRSVKIKGATFLNDVTVAPDGTVYVSDSGLEQWGPYVEPNDKDAVYRLDGNKAVPIASGKQLGNPNGLLADGSGLFVVNKAGELFRLDAAGTRSDLAKLPKGGLDGVVKTDAGLAISSWDAKGVYLERDGGFALALEKVSSPADIGYDATRKRVLIPVLTESALRIEAM